jgi:hypothetical protein
VHATTSAPWSFANRPSYVSAGALAADDAGSPDLALEVLLRRYLEGFGPATIADVARFALVQRARVKVAVEALGDELERLEGPGGAVLFDVPGSPPSQEEDLPAPPRLLPMWDSVLLAYDDRSRVVPEPYRTVVARNNGDVLPTILVDGYVAGVWRPTDGGIECTAFHELRREEWDALAVEAAALTALLQGRDPRVYGRFGHWWSRFAGADVRLLPGA